MDSRYYPGVEVDAPRLIAELRQVLDAEEYEVQTMQVSATSVLQARKTGTLREITGLSAALTVKITSEHGGTRVEIGMQKWFDKAAVAALTMIVMPWLVALPALGAYWQHQLTEKSWRVVEEHITRQAGGYVPPLPGRCGSCGATNVAGSAFCSSCGADLRLNRCNSCGAQQREPNARYCSTCGKPLAG